ncbi:YneF family protein [Candidatus Mycoplasma haematominutum]|uniref:YneF family protein n=1 Tax=Candidatus Mycoplasma haematominutum 'Birmingham 1' TaxID=1116213 RepID=G8C3B3_9MOLU|nr:YneF family protein [Candidatus Mycoplasma haematominutum]CCE66811.1 conserved hypothetical protein [Candidatus Mycoplasma haematominutum 'Birmingham 1']
MHWVFSELLFFNSEHIGWGVGLVACMIISAVATWKFATWKYSKQIGRKDMITASQVRELYKQIGRTPTEKQIKQMLAAVNNKTRN